MPRPALIVAVVALPVLAWAVASAYLGGPKDEVDAAFARTATQEGRTEAYLDAQYRFDPAIRDTVLAALTPERLDAFAYAWRALDACAYTRTRRTEQRTEDDLLLNAVEVDERRTAGAAQTVRTDSARAFEFGYFTRYLSLNAATYDPLHVEAVGLKTLDLLAPTEERYVFRADRDTVLSAGPVRIFEAEARPGLGDGLNVRLLRVFYDRARKRIVGVHVHRIDLGDFHREEAVVSAVLSPDRFGRLLPGTTRFQTLGKVPFREPMRFETVARTTDFDCPQR